MTELILLSLTDSRSTSSRCHQWAPADSKRPCLPEMLAMPRRDGSKVNIPKQIGCEYQTFGILLLHDENGLFVENIIHDNKENGVEDVNISIIREWLKGKGRLPVSWKTLIEVLLEMNLKVLAGDIEGRLTPQLIV